MKNLFSTLVLLVSLMVTGCSMATGYDQAKDEHLYTGETEK